MSMKAETFFAIACDFPECGELYEDGEFTYYADGPDTGLLDEDGWFYDDNTNEATCPAHTIEVECPPELQALDPGSDDGVTYCQWCEDHSTDTHLAPMPDTWENRLKWRLDLITLKAHRELDWLERKLTDQHGPLGDYGSHARVLDKRLREIWERTCRSWKPDITPQELHDLQHPPRRPRATFDDLLRGTR